MTPTRYDVRITLGAERDLEGIHDFLLARSRTAANALLNDLLLQIEALETFPSRGSVPEELRHLGIEDYRQVVVGHYRVIYRVIGSTVFILLVADGRRDMQRLLEERLLRP